MIRPLDVIQAYARANGVELVCDDVHQAVLGAYPTWKDREFTYKISQWTKAEIPLTKCYIRWDMGMGWRKWAKGSVRRVANQFKKYPLDPQWAYVKNIKNGLKVLPIIVYALGGGQYEIDDGCHRAVASYLAGNKKIEAYVGVRPEVVK